MTNQDVSRAVARNTFNNMLYELERLINQYRDGKREQPLSDLHLKLFEAEQYARDHMMLLFDGSNIQDRILAAIDSTSAGYLAAWSICDAIGMDRLTIQDHKYPRNEYEQALKKLVDNGTLEELTDLSFRYRRKKLTPQDAVSR